jgi:hypothetical protein
MKRMIQTPAKAGILAAVLGGATLSIAAGTAMRTSPAGEAGDVVMSTVDQAEIGVIGGAGLGSEWDLPNLDHERID